TEVIVNALVTQGSAIGNLGRFDEAEAIMRGAMLLADKSGHVIAALRARNNLVSQLVWEARVSTLLPIMNESVDLALRYGFAGWGAQHVLSRVVALSSMGDWDGARSDLALVEEWDLSELHAALRSSGKALLAAATGETAVAERYLEEARDMLSKIDTVPQVTAVASGISLIHVLLGEWAAALAVVAGLEGGGNDPFICQYSSWAAAAAGDRDTIGVLLERSDAFDRLRVNNAIRAQVAASAATVDGRWDEGRAGYVAAVAEYRELDYNLEAAILGLEFAAFLGDRFDDARAAGDAAETWFGEHDASSVVERYRANFRGTPAPPTGSGSTHKRAVPVDAEQRA
ncbi:MAG TPA: hypothetical protein VJ839_03140, partial [Candidatus Limnocylindria bacterium]|nr:hypothetical protein [Candidatus Limnocylindria bacterium]